MKNKTEHRANNLHSNNKDTNQRNGIQIPSIALPKGGGAIKGIDEKFSVNAANGTAAFSFSLPFTEARGETPAISLSYNSGSGNGVFGLGWKLNVASIKRKTDKAIPQYKDSIDSDTFLFAETEDLVPAFKKKIDGSFEVNAKGNFVIDDRDSSEGQFRIRYYKPRIEGAFSRIERWLEKDSGIIKWKITSKENHTTLFGWTEKSRISNPKDETKIYEWLPEFAFDDKGNCIHYLYRKEDELGLDKSSIHNRNRLNDGKITYTNTYVCKVLYGNKNPYTNFGDTFPMETDYLFSTVFDYGSIDNTDFPTTLNTWDFRPDPFSSYKGGIEIRTTRLCKRILFHHHFEEYNGLVRSVNFDYSTNKEEDFSFLRSITQCGYIKKSDGNYSHKMLPPIEFAYQEPSWNKEIKTISKDQFNHSLFGLNQQEFQFTDLYNEGLNGILTEQSNSWYYNQNLGHGEFAPAKMIASKPSFEGLGSTLHLVDLNADGGKQLVSFNGQESGYFELNDDNEWQNFRAFSSIPNINFRDNNARMLDLDGDNRPEVVFAEDNAFTWYPSNGRSGFHQAQRSSKSFDAETGPAIAFDNQEQNTLLADMSGDGLSDIVKIRNGDVCYWPNLGNGRFGSKISMDNAPVFDNPESFNPSFLKLVDIDGSGTTDLIYLGNNKFTCWKNLCGNRFSNSPYTFDSLPEIHNATNVVVTDVLGNGVPCLLWSDPLAKDGGTELKYIDLMGSKKPHVMVSFKNNLGKEISLEYKPSTYYYLDDKNQGRPWKSKLFFPVHCVSKTIVEDKISGHRHVSEYKYHHGYYDHSEREFRGFGMVEQFDAESFEHWEKANAKDIIDETLQQEPVVSKTWYHTGAFSAKDDIISQYKEDFWFNEMDRRGFEVNHHERALPDVGLVRRIGKNAEPLDGLSAQEWQEALRACKGNELRTEIFAFDAVRFGNTTAARKKELCPFIVTDQNYLIELVQPKGQNQHAVFAVRESEVFCYNYERNPDDPRTTHNLNLRSDEIGNVLESASVVYPRRTMDMLLPNETRQEQNKTSVIYTENKFTNDVISDNSYRLRLPSEVKKYELKAVAKSNEYFQPADFHHLILNVQTDEVAFHKQDNYRIKGSFQRRLMEHVRHSYYKNDLSDALPFHQLESLAFPYESFQLTYTPELISEIFENRVDASLLEAGQFMHTKGDSNWWMRSSRTQYIRSSETAEDAKNRFYQPIAYTDPFQAKTKVKYYRSYWLMIEETEDVLGNRSSVERFNFRNLTPEKMRDINGNLSETIIDELGFVKAHAVLGKGNQADDLEGINEFTDEAEGSLIQSYFNAADSNQLTSIGKNLLRKSTSRFIYDVDAYSKYDQPTAISTIKRETHYRNSDGDINSESRVQIAFEYSNGVGEVIMKKNQAIPGKAKHVVLQGDDSIVIKEINTALSDSKQLRWLGTGRTIKNNKGNVVKKYEPYFSVSHLFEDYKELVETGVTPRIFYDAVGRMARTINPDGTIQKIAFDSWKQVTYDENDCLLASSWYIDRTQRAINAQLQAAGKNPATEKVAADKAARHADTPTVYHLDTLGRPVLSIEHNRNATTQTDEFYHTKIQFDIQGNMLSIVDARGNTLMEYKYDLLRNKVYQKSMDAGRRWLFNNVLGKSMRTWDERGHEFQYYYDAAQRPTESKVIGGEGPAPLDHIFSRVIYGESLLSRERANEAELQVANVLGQPIKNYDTAGMVETPAYDFNRQQLSSTRKLFKKYNEIANWVDANLEKDLEIESYTYRKETNAFGSIIKKTSPDGSLISPQYDEAGMLCGKSVLHPGESTPTTYIKDIEYNSKGQMEKVIYGNNVSTRFYYDEKTFHLCRLQSKRQNGDHLQDWRYTFDPVGNITHIEDMNIPTVFFNNQKITGASEYTYDALYRLQEAKGRENTGMLNFGSCDNWDDKPFMREMQWGDPMAVRNYVQSYQYDAVGNITEMKHKAPGGNWTRQYKYESDNNRLFKTSIGDVNKPVNYTSYGYHAQHGFLIDLPHLEKIGWNFKEEVVLTSKQRCSGDNIPVMTYYQYDNDGNRIRKITENRAVAGNAYTKKEERIYIDGYELYRKHSGPHAGLERVSLSLMDGGHRFVMIETRNEVNDGTEKQLVRYQLHNHLGSTSLELDGTSDANVISYEEYHPYGTTAYQAKNKAIKSAAKRYRYTGMERDEETGLQYHNARYYMPWLGRWLSCDPLFSEIHIRDATSKSDDRISNNEVEPGHRNGHADKPPANKHSSQKQNDMSELMNSAQPSTKSSEPDNESGRGKASRQEELLILEHLNLYAYCHQNPMTYTDPSGQVPIFQAWLNGWNNAGSTGAKVGFGILFIFAWLAHVIVNIVMLALSITILNPLGLFGAWDFSFGGLQSVIGVLFGVVMILLGGSVLPYKGAGAKIEAPSYMGSGWGISLGPVVTGASGFSDWDHEFGHTWQSRVLGPFYLFIIGIPSIISAGSNPGAHSGFFTERWADSWAF